ncbi:MAG: 50S ribosomal protein L11 [Pseudomonadota bacterium]|nr:50S ribosomal protein L11 [Pseudomonadota bacterium]
MSDVKYVKLKIMPGKANPSPPVGPALGQHGVNIMDFCKAFNDKTKDMDKDLPCPVVLTVKKDKSFTFVIKTPPASALIKKELDLKKGSQVPNKDKVGILTLDQLKKIAAVKMPDLNADTEFAAVKIIAGTAKSMGVDIDANLEECND